MIPPPSFDAISLNFFPFPKKQISLFRGTIIAKFSGSSFQSYKSLKINPFLKT